MRHYTVVFTYDPETASFGVRVPALPGCYSDGATVEEALRNVREAIVGHIEALEAIGAAIPVEDAVPEGAVRAVEDSADGAVLLSRIAA